MPTVLPYLRSVPLVALLGVASMAFQPTEQTWAVKEITFQVDPDGSDDIDDGSDVEAVRSAFATWAAVECAGLQITEETWEGPGINSPDGKNMVFWVNRTDGWLEEEKDTLALTFAWTADFETIADADTALNGAYYEWSTDGQTALTDEFLDVETVVLHEVGHFLGLGHSQDEAAVMYAENNKLVQRDLDEDDVNGLCFLYGDGEGGGGTGGGGPGCEPDENDRLGPGCVCERPSDCASGVCFDDRQLLGKQYCVEPCVKDASLPECPSGFVCEDTLGAGFQCLLPVPSTNSLCQLCNGPGQCATGLCAVANNINAGQPFCSFPCAPDNPNACPQGYECIVTQQAASQVSVCAPTAGICDPPDRGGHNQPPNLDGSCDPGHRSLEYGLSGIPFCYRLCDNPGNPCEGLTDAVCDPVENLTDTFVCRTVRLPLQRCFPEFCASRNPGFPALCFQDGPDPSTDSVCYQLCDDTGDCDANQQCVSSQDGIAACVPVSDGFKELGEICRNDGECIDEAGCRIRGDEKRCTQACSLGSDECGAGFECFQAAQGDGGLCWPTGGGGGGNGAACICDVTDACDGNCGCDPDCGPICVCDLTEGCDADCDCDTACGTSSCTHLPIGDDPVGTLVITLVFGLFWRLARRKKRPN